MLDKSLEYIPVLMETHHASQYPRYELPKGYTLSAYQEGFEWDWGRIEQRACNSESAEKDAQVFLKVFGADWELAKTNCLFILDEKGVPVATGSLWMGQMNGKSCPRLHYIATDPAHEGKGLCKAILTAVFDLQQQKGYGEYMFLTSQTWSHRAIRLYERFGFQAYMGKCPDLWTDYPDFDEKNVRAWKMIRAKHHEFEESRCQ